MVTASSAGSATRLFSLDPLSGLGVPVIPAAGVQEGLTHVHLQRHRPRASGPRTAAPGSASVRDLRPPLELCEQAEPPRPIPASGGVSTGCLRGCPEQCPRCFSACLQVPWAAAPSPHTEWALHAFAVIVLPFRRVWGCYSEMLLLPQPLGLLFRGVFCGRPSPPDPPPLHCPHRASPGPLPVVGVTPSAGRPARCSDWLGHSHGREGCR